MMGKKINYLKLNKIGLVLAIALFSGSAVAQDTVDVEPSAVTLTNLQGTVQDIQDDPLNPDEPNRFLNATDDGTDTEALVDFNTPNRNLVQGTNQVFEVLVRQTGNNNRDPDVTIELLENGGQVATLVNRQAVNSPDGEVFTGSWDASQLADLSGSGVQARISGKSTGGNPKDTVEIGAVNWEAQVESLTNPEINLSSPVEGSTFGFGSNVTFDYNVTTFDEAANVTLYLNDNPVAEREQGIGEVNYQDKVENFDAGNYSWYIEANGTSTFNQSQTRNFTVEEAQNPDINLTAPSDGQQFSYESNVDLEFDVETFEEPANIEVYVNSTSNNEELVGTFNQASGTNQSYVKTLQNLANDTYDWRVEASNQTTFSQNSSSFEVLQPQDPGINLINPNDGATLEYGSDVNFEYEVETIDESAEVRLYLDNNLIKTSQQQKGTINSYSETIENFEEGSYQWRVEANGSLTSNQASRTFQIGEPDRPNVNLTNPADATTLDYDSDVEYKFDVGTAQEKTNISLIENGVEIFSAQQLKNTEKSYTYIVNSQNRGSYNWEVETSTGFYGVNSSETRTYTIDDPNISINSTSPNDGKTFGSSTREVEFNWSLDTPIEGNTRLYLNGTVEEDIRVNSLNQQLNFNSTLEVQDGENYEWYAEFESDEGDLESTEVRTFQVNKSDISEDLISPEQHEALGNQTVGFEWDVESSENYYVELYVDNLIQSNQTGTSGNTTFTFEDVYSDGQYDWFIEVHAESGNVVKSATRRYFVDTQIPVFSSKKDDSGGNVLEGQIVNTSVFWESQEADLNKSYFYDNTSGTLTQTGQFTFNSGLSGFSNNSINTSGLSGETVCWREEAKDEAGNLNSSMDSLCFDVVEELNVTTDNAVNITFSSVDLIGELNNLSKFNQSNVFFEYRQSGQENWQTTSSETLNAPNIFDKEINNLKSNTQYEFRAVAGYSGVEAKGDILTLTTNERPNIILESPEDGATVSPPANFKFTPYCDAGCQDAELYFNTTETGIFNFLTSDKADWDEGTFSNVSSIDSFDGDYIQLKQVVKTFVSSSDSSQILKGLIVGGSLTDTENKDGNTYDIEQDFKAGKFVSQNYTYANNFSTDEASKTIDVANVSRINVTMRGAGGGEGSDQGTIVAGGSGGFVNATIDVSSFDQIEIWAGQGGSIGGTGAWGRSNGGDSGGNNAGSGGGSTEIVAGDGTFLAAADAGGGASGQTSPPGKEIQGGGGGARGGLGGTGDVNGQDAGGTGSGGDGGSNAGPGGDGGQEINQEFAVISDTLAGGGSAQNQGGEIQIEYEEEDSAELDARFNFSTEAVNPQELRFETRASTSQNVFNYSVYNFELGEFQKLDTVESTTLSNNITNVCASGCDLEANPGAFTNNNGEITTKFEASDNNQDTLSVDYLSVEVDSEEFEKTGTYQSKTFDAGKKANWTSSTIQQSVPSGTVSNITYAENSTGSFQFYDSLSQVPSSRYLKYLFEFEGDGLSTPEVKSVDIQYERDVQEWKSRENITKVVSGGTNNISFNFSKQELPNSYEWNIKITDDGGETFFAQNNRTVKITEPQVDLNTSLIEIFNVTGVADKRNSGNLLDSGTNKTFKIDQKDRQRQYRFSFTVDNNGLKDWDISGGDTLRHKGLNSTWTVTDSYYDVNNNIFEGSNFADRVLEWNTAGGLLQSGSSLEANYIVETDTVSSNFYSMEFNASMENSTSNDLHKLNKTKYGFLNISLNQPPETFTVQRNQTFDMNVSIKCEEGKCGDVDASARINSSGTEPGSLIPIDESESPFYIVDSTNTRDCGVMENGDTCKQVWEVNATGKLNTTRLIDSQATTSLTEVENVDTRNSEVTIAEALILDIEWDKIDFGAIGPGESNVSALGNDNQKFNVTIPSNSVDADKIEIKSEDLNNSVNDGYYIGAENMSYSLENKLTSQNPLNEEYQLLNQNINSGTTFSTYYWINVPQGIRSDNYSGVISFEASTQ